MANETWWSYYDNMNNTGGGGGGGVTVLTEDENGALNKTWAEIKELPFAVLKRESEHNDTAVTKFFLLTRIIADRDSDPAEYTVSFGNLSGEGFFYKTDSPSGYPILPDDGGGDDGGGDVQVE